MKFYKSFTNSLYMAILVISVYYLFFITCEFNMSSSHNEYLQDDTGKALVAGFKFVFLFILNLVIYAVISYDKFDIFMEIIKKISAYLFVLPVIFSFILLNLLPILDTNFKNFLFSLILNLYTLFVGQNLLLKKMV